MTNRRVLLIAYYFPPLGGAGVGRPLQLAKYLPEHGWECDVLTVKPIAYRVFEPELLEQIPDTRVYRAGSWDPQRLARLIGIRKLADNPTSAQTAGSRRFFPDSKTGWVSRAIKEGLRLANREPYDAIISSSPPISSHLVGMSLHHSTQSPWIADFRDFWTSYKIDEVYDNAGFRKRAHELLDQFRNTAIIVNCNSAISEYHEAGETIYNAVDDDLARLWKPPAEGSRFVIGLLGTYDRLVPLEPLFKALSSVIDSRPEFRDQVSLVHVGRAAEDYVTPLLEKYKLQLLWKSYGFQPRARTIELLNDARLFYLALDLEKGADIVPGRLFTMLNSGRPILAAVKEESPVGRLVFSGRFGGCFDGDNDMQVEKAAEFLSTLIQLNSQGDPPYDPEAHGRHLASDMAKQFAKLIERVASAAHTKNQK